MNPPNMLVMRGMRKYTYTWLSTMKSSSCKQAKYVCVHEGFGVVPNPRATTIGCQTFQLRLNDPYT